MKKYLWAVLLLAFLLRAALTPIGLFHPSRALQPDSQPYLDPALQLLSTGFYPPDSALRMPVYPLFIALLYRLFGQNILVLLIAQVILGVSSVYFTYLLGRRLASPGAALLGALLLALSIESITSGFYILNETLFTFLLLAGMLLFLMAVQEKKKTLLAASALLLALAALCRPGAYIFPLLLVMILLLDKSFHLLKRLAHTALFLGIFLVCLLPWLVRNLYTIGSLTLTTITSYNLLYYEAAPLESSTRQLDISLVRQEFRQRVLQTLSERGWADNEGNRSRVESLLARQVIFAHPLRFLLIHLKGDLNGLLPEFTGPAEILGFTVGGRGTLGILNQYGLFAAIRNYFGAQVWLLGLLLPIALLLLLEYLFALMGTIDILRKQKGSALIILALPVLFFLVLPGPASLPRFRVPVMPYICLLAIMGLFTLLKQSRNPKS